MTAYNHDMGISVEILYSKELQTGEQVSAPASSQDWDGKTPLKVGDLVEKPGFSGPEWYSLVPKVAPKERNRSSSRERDWHLGHRDDW
jgi:hypothetical protein